MIFVFLSCIYSFFAQSEKHSFWMRTVAMKFTKKLVHAPQSTEWDIPENEDFFKIKDQNS